MVRHSSPRPGQPSVAVNPAVCRTGHMEIQTTLCYRLCGENGMELRGISSVQGGENSAEAMKVAADTIQGETLTGLSGQRRFSYSVMKKGSVQTARPQVGLAVLPVQQEKVDSQTPPGLTGEFFTDNHLVEEKIEELCQNITMNDQMELDVIAAMTSRNSSRNLLERTSLRQVEEGKSWGVATTGLPTHQTSLR